MSLPSWKDFASKNELPTRDCDLDLARKTYILSQRKITSGEGSSRTRGKLDEERTRLAFHQANKVELEERVAKGELFPVSAFKTVLEDMLTSFKANMISIAPKVAAQVVAMADENDAEDLIQGYVYEALDELSDYDLTDAHIDY